MLNATDQELNTWVSLKQVTKYQRQDEINGDKAYWQRQANNMKRKKQVFKSIYGTEEEKGMSFFGSRSFRYFFMNSKCDKYLVKGVAQPYLFLVILCFLDFENKFHFRSYSRFCSENS